MDTSALLYQLLILGYPSMQIEGGPDYRSLGIGPENIPRLIASIGLPALPSLEAFLTGPRSDVVYASDVAAAAMVKIAAAHPGPPCVGDKFYRVRTRMC